MTVVVLYLLFQTSHILPKTFCVVQVAPLLVAALSRARYRNIFISIEIKRWRNVVAMPKFMQSLNQEIYNRLHAIAESRGITVQELIRAVIIPDWLKEKKREKQ